MNNSRPSARNFIRDIIDADRAAGKHGGRVVTRFPPEPNGYLHIGHAKSICLNFGIARDYQGVCHLRFDDTNPTKESLEYVEAIKRDIRWLGFDWGEKLYHASDYFERLHEYALELIRSGKAYVDSLNAEQIRAYRGTLSEPGQNSPDRDRPMEENLDLFQRMRAGQFKEGEYVLRAKIDMSSPNLNMRDPVIYRIKHVPHQMTGRQWCIYPMYDYTHCLSDAVEGITHSLCTLEFEDHRPLYDWVLDNLDVPCHPQQIEFARLNLDYTVMSKRKLNLLVEGGYVSGWDDPRLPTISGLRRRGYTPEAIQDFCERIGLTKKDTIIEVGSLENCVREDLENKAPRAFAVLRPLRVVIENYPEGQSEELDAPNHPNRPEMGSRKIPFSREIYIERSDFMEQPPKDFYRLAPGQEVRLRYAYVIGCQGVVKDDAGNLVELRCTYGPDTKSGSAKTSRKVKGTIHWVCAQRSILAEVRLYDRLFVIPDPDQSGEFLKNLNPASIEFLTEARMEPSLRAAPLESRYQFERQGYFYLDPIDSTPARLVFNRTVTLRDSWVKRLGG
ncbi:MAG: glutamine--tRNA ligase/YqeY domain fusion protein [Gammaproteobacteria bacterium]